MVLGLAEFKQDEYESSDDPWKCLNDTKVQILKYYLQGKIILWVPNPLDENFRQYEGVYNSFTVSVGNVSAFECFDIECVEIHSPTVITSEVLDLLISLFKRADKV